ncbi:PucR family transcriptional regulator ligand-binding domain-containing protein [Streptomyces sp. NBC_00829]|uniref:PucR family transcriptional regulator ligand-binding domain-containing protein n=1 Tax=Streptomyces sp. NBC_00829 TaxID=2903679 RepID=UPI00386EDA31|nr:PucR family transcriptional regulator ligand-binding domain-containing protein [Streptomyces sp. NBC_00829]
MPETTAAPPTPPIPLAALLAREDLGLRQIAGPVEAGAAVHMVHTSEMADPYPYLLGGEMLLSAGVLLKDPDMYVSRIVEAGATALGFGLAPVHDTVPAELIEACDRHGLPLIEVPPQTTFTAVARAVWRLMAEARHRELRRVTQAQQGLAAAAARPDPVPAVLHQLAARLGGLAVLLGPDGTTVASSGRTPSAEVMAGLTRLARVVHPDTSSGGTARPAPASATDTVSPPPVSASAEPAGAASAQPGSPAPAATTGPRNPSPAASTGTRNPAPAATTGPWNPSPAASTRPSSPAPAAPAVSHLSAYALGGSQGLVLGLAAPAREAGDHTVAGVAVVLLSLLTAPHQGADAAGRSSALVRLLLGAGPAETASQLGPEPWTVVRGRGGDNSPFAASALGAALGSTLVDRDADGDVRVLLPASGEVAPQPGWTLGASAPTGPGDLAAADVQAARALRHATATRKDLVRHRDTTPVGLDEARRRLAPLAGSPALVETLRTWLSLHGSWDRTATAMDVHRNTVRQRVGRCAALLGEDLDDPDVRMELWFALRHG